jgi:UDP-N-acetylmuramate dehydrogenase
MSLLSKLPAVRGEYRENCNLGKFCWFKVGGDADVLYKPQDAEDLQAFFKGLPEDVDYFVFGVGSNLLVRDSGYRGVAIRLGREFNYARVTDQGTVIAGAAMLDVNLADFCAEHGLSGLEFYAGIPGTIGGALAMNAGAYGSETKDVLISAKAVNRSGEMRIFKVDELGYTYRHKGISDEWVFVEAEFKVTPAKVDEIKAKIQEIQISRNSTQPIRTKTGGSTFKNPEGHKAWQLIDAAGCRGLKIGGAKVSEMHCNFFINDGDATATDIENLIKEVQNRVFTNSGIQLEPEIKIIG